MFRVAVLLLVLAALAHPPLADATGAAYLVKDIVPARCVYEPGLSHVPCDSNPTGLVALGDTLFFEAVDEDGVWHLWKSDGTTDGTVQVGDVAIAGSYDPSPPVLVNGTLFFFGNPGNGMSGLWKSDGTAGGTGLVADTGTLPLLSPELHVLAGKLFITTGLQLWTIDGAAGGTVQLVDFSARQASDTSRWRLTERAGEVFFSFCEEGGNCELWKSDGTAAGTARVAVMVPPYHDPADQLPPSIYSLVNANGTVFLSVCEENWDCDLWTSDGTTDGTVRVARRPQSIYQDDSWGPLDLTALGGSVFFSDCESGCELWTSDGTAAGTRLFADLTPGGDSFWYWGLHLTPVGGALLFGTDSTELWRTDGTLTGTFRISPNLGLDYPASAGTMAYFMDYGSSVYQSDGTVAGTFPIVRTEGIWLASADTPQFAVAGQRLFFTAWDPVHGRELWAVSLDGNDPARCGDGLVEPGEECDDGNPTGGDGCDGLCRLERPPTAPTTTSTSSTISVTVSTTTTSTTSTLAPSPTTTIPLCRTITCDDGDPCTVDRCDDRRGCVSEPDEYPDSACLIRRAGDTVGCAPPRLAQRLLTQFQRVVGCLGRCGQCRRPARDALIGFRRTVTAGLRARTLGSECATRLRALVANPCAPDRGRSDGR